MSAHAFLASVYNILQSKHAQPESRSCATGIESGEWWTFLAAEPMLQRGKEVKILSFPTITAEQISASLLAIPAFLPATLCTGYLAAWFTNLHNFRQRSMVERIFWSVPLSIAVSTIASVLIGKFFSLAAVVVFLVATAALWLVVIGNEWFQLRGNGRKWNIGWSPLGGTALMLAILWIVVAVFSLVDLESNHHLFMNTAILDQCFRIDWTDSVLRTGVPPANPLYFYKSPAIMRNYYFWYVICAVVAKMAHLPVRAVFVASSVWAGFLLASLNGLFLKHFLAAGAHLRRQFLRSVLLLMVTGLDICVIFWNLLYFHLTPPFDLEAWSKDPVISWFDTLLWSPHHIVGMVCCMFAFLLAWMAGKDGEPRRTASVAMIAVALASAFGLSIYVTFAFFLVMVVWALWQVAIERKPRPALLLAAGGAGAGVLLIPYLRELTRTASKMQGGAAFAFSVRQTIPPDGLLSTSLFQHLATGHPVAALNLAKLVLLAPGYTIELGFFLAVFLIYLVPAWRGRAPLTPAQRSLLVIAVATVVFMSLMRSDVLTLNDFGFRSALLLQFPLLLLASEAITRWSLEDLNRKAPALSTGLHRGTPNWLRSIATLALFIGTIGVVSQALWFRFIVPVAESAKTSAGNAPEPGTISHNAYISSIGYAQLDASIPREAVVQFNPTRQELYLRAADFVGVDHQTAIAGDQQGCGSELGGDPSGCPAMAAAIDSLYHGASAEQARATCQEFGIQYLVARVYDPPWKDKSGWVWTLAPVVADDEFRVLNCGQ